MLDCYKFKNQGILKDQAAVLGVITSDHFPERPLLLVLTEGASDHKRRQTVLNAKEEAQRFIISGVEHDSQKLSDIFAKNAKNDITGKVSCPYEVESTLDVILEETDRGVIVLDCKDKLCFWAALRVLGTSKKDLFPIAELDVFKQEPQVKQSKKPIIDAHELCRGLYKHKTIFDKSSAYYINLIKAAVKVKAPDVSYVTHRIFAQYQRDLDIINGNIEEGFSQIVKIQKMKCRILSIFNKNSTLIANSSPVLCEQYKKLLQIKLGISDDMFLHSDDEDLEKGDFLDGPVIVSGAHKEQKLKDFYEEVIGLKEFEDIEPLFKARGLKVGTAHFRDGTYHMPYNKMLISMGLDFDNEKIREYGKKTSQEYVSIPKLNQYVLLESNKEGDEITLNIFTGKQGEKSYALRSDYYQVYLNDDGSINSIWSDNHITKDRRFAQMLGMSSLSISVAQALSTLARMNEPDFFEHRVKPVKGVRASIKGHFPYFEAIDIPSFGPTAEYRSIDPDGGTTSSVRLHRVRRHSRRIFDQETGALKKVISIPSHLRGNPEEGVLSKSIDIS